MATKPRARRKPAETNGNPSAKLIEALQFISMAQAKNGPVQSQFCMLMGKWAVASNGFLTIGAKIEEDLEVCPHTFQLIEALKLAVDGDQVIAHESPAVLSVRAGAFAGLVACVNRADLPIPSAPDNQCALVDSRLTDALDAVQFLAMDESPDAFKASILLRAGSAVATDGSMMLEYWHGIDLPPGLMVPRKAAQAIVKCKKAPVGFGFSSASMTIWFEDDSFIKTQLYSGNYPDTDRIFPENVNAWPLPEGFFKAVHVIANFSEDGKVVFNNGKVASAMEESVASTFKIEGLVEEMAFNAKYLIDAQLYMKTAHFDTEKGRVIFFGDNCRGIIMGLNNFERKREAEQQAAARAANPKQVIRPGTTGFDDLDDDIPF